MKTPGLTIEFAGVETWPEGSATIIEQAIDAACDHQDVLLSLPAELSILLTDDAAVRALNCEWRGKDSPTNVLSFPADSPSVPGVPRLLGDIVFARETVEREAVEQNKAVEAHIMHLAIHGFLHLLGFDHIDPSEAENMEAHEVDILATLDVANPYLDLDAA